MFTVRDVALEVPDALLNDALASQLMRGRYEVHEASAAERHLRPGDRVLELGAGCGYLAVVMGRIVGGTNVVTVEANPAMLPVIEGNLARNNVAGVTLVHGAAVAEAEPSDVLRFRQSHAFWAGSVVKESGARTIEVPALALDALIATHQPTVMMADVEGAEADFFQSELPDDLRLITLEIHPKRYGPRKINAIFRRLMRQGFAYQPYGSQAAVLTFERIA